ncbi:MAG: HDOD domain-containing protein [Thermodesulfobacteriota bacterium]
MNIDDLKAGMILDSDLIGPNNRFLLPRGATLDTAHIRMLKAWGVTEADVSGVTREQAQALAEAELSPDALARARGELTPYFAHADLEHPAMREIFRLCVQRWARGAPSDCALVGLESCPLPEPGIGPRKDVFAKGEGTPASLVRSEVELTSFPDIYFQINEVLQSPRSSASHIADVVSKDTSLTAKLLKLVNSAFYGFPAKIDTISRAIAILGTNELTTLALGISVVENFANIPESLVDMKGFWKHSVACGVLSRILASSKVGLSEERFFVAGLIHDVGRLVMFKRLPFASTQALVLSRSTRTPLREVEQEVLGFDHSAVSGALLKAWKFPATLELPVRHHHAPSNAMNPLEPSIIHVADVLAIAMQYGSSGSAYVPPLQEKAWENLGQGPGILAQAMAQADRQISEILRAFLGNL